MSKPTVLRPDKIQLKEISHRDFLSAGQRVRLTEEDTHHDAQKLIIHSNSGVYLIENNDISYCHADSNYCRIHCRDGQKMLVSKTLKWIASRLISHQFERIHQSILVNVDEIRWIGKNEVALTSGQQLPLSRRYRQLLIQRVQNKYSGIFFPKHRSSTSKTK